MQGMSQHGLPLGGNSPQTQHASASGAEAAKVRAIPQLVRYIRLLLDHPDGLTDIEAAALLGCQRTSICARRGELEKAGLVQPLGFRRSPVDGESRNTVFCWAGR